MMEAIDRRCYVNSFQSREGGRHEVFRGTLEECLNWCELNPEGYGCLSIYQPIIAFERMATRGEEITRTVLVDETVTIPLPKRKKK